MNIVSIKLHFSQELSFIVILTNSRWAQVISRRIGHTVLEPEAEELGSRYIVVKYRDRFPSELDATEEKSKFRAAIASWVPEVTSFSPDEADDFIQLVGLLSF